MTRKEKKEELIGLFAVGAIYIGDLIDECFDFGQQHPHWISVEEQFPPIGSIVLVAIPLGGEMSVLPLSIKNESDFEYLSGMAHWMPLPAPPVVSKSSNVGKEGGEK